ncbi:MAG: TetR family transcriptional regulator [Caulobacteraceae bacterium]
MSDNESVQILGRRAESKAKTRRKVLESARHMFAERGYEGATMREIASHAGMSTGALFANFTDKADLFNEVMSEDLQAQAERLQAVQAGDKPLRQALIDGMRTGYEFHLEQLPLLRAAIGVSWTHGLAGELGERPINAAVIGYFVEALEAAQANGALRKDADVKLAAEMLWDVYMANYRRAVFGGWKVKQLTDYATRQIDLLLAGVGA